jgi:hypothetical protein
MPQRGRYQSFAAESQVNPSWDASPRAVPADDQAGLEARPSGVRIVRSTLEMVEDGMVSGDRIVGFAVAPTRAPANRSTGPPATGVPRLRRPCGPTRSAARPDYAIAHQGSLEINLLYLGRLQRRDAVVVVKLAGDGAAAPPGSPWVPVNSTDGR